MRVEGRITEQEYPKYMLLAQWKSCLFMYGDTFLIFMLVFGVVVMNMNVFPLILLSLALASMCTYLFALHMYRNARKQYRRDGSLQDLQVLNIDHEGLNIQYTNGAQAWTWNELHQVIEHQSFFRIYITKKSFFFLPKAFFHDSASLLTFKRLVSHRLSDEQVKLKRRST